MNGSPAILVDHVGKKYCKSLKKSMFYGIQDIAKNTVGMGTNSRILRKDEFWAVDDVSFSLNRGEILGIIGSNGAGKTTLLKMLNGIFWPDKGKITISGNVGALIAVGAGFHPMLTGRENIYVNGAILGMSKMDIDDKFDSIVDFADIGDFLDTSIKFYSSGMFVRLGFSIAVHGNPDILLVDEILSVGDVEFQNKCMNKIGELMAKGITTVLVSHNMISIRRICGQCIWVDAGKIKKLGDPLEVTNEFQTWSMEKGKNTDKGSNNDQDLHIEDIFFFGEDGKRRDEFVSDEPIHVGIIVRPEIELEGIKVEIKVKSSMGIEILHIFDPLEKCFTPQQKQKIVLRLKKIPLSKDLIHANVLLWNKDMTQLYARRSSQNYFRIDNNKISKGNLDVSYKLYMEEWS